MSREAACSTIFALIGERRQADRVNPAAATEAHADVRNGRETTGAAVMARNGRLRQIAAALSDRNRARRGALPRGYAPLARSRREIENASMPASSASGRQSDVRLTALPGPNAPSSSSPVTYPRKRGVALAVPSFSMMTSDIETLAASERRPWMPRSRLSCGRDRR